MRDQAASEAGNRDNNFGFLRLLFATLVIVSHSPELVDGNRSREILTSLFGTISFGELGVDGFFIISGYLVAKSFTSTETIKLYFSKRFFRIFPGYLACFLICALLLAPIAGASDYFSFKTVAHLFRRLIHMMPPEVDGTFQGLHYPVLNGAMWTIPYEFRCYIIIAILGAFGLFRPRYRPYLLCAVAVLLALNASGLLSHTRGVARDVFGSLPNNIRFEALFGTGMLYYLYRTRISFTHWGAAISLALLIPLMFNRALAEMAVAVLGGYLIFWFSFKIKALKISRFTNETDISYGLYLYAWPVQNFVIWNYRDMNPWLLCLVTVVSAGCLAYASWVLVEKPWLDFAHKRRAARMNADAADRTA